MKGGYQALGRLASTLDEISIEAQVGASEPSLDTMRRAFEEIARLTNEARRFVQYISPLSAAGA
jgi:hypothetical protein